MNSKNKKTFTMVLAALFTALIIVMTVVPFTGYISYGGIIEITTLHIVVILGAALLGPVYGSYLGLIWGITCVLRAFTNPLWAMFTNPLISVVPRILVGFVAGFVCRALSKKLSPVISAGLAALIGSLTNTILVLSAMYIFGGMIESFAGLFEMFKTIYMTVASLNGGIELIAAIILVPAIYVPVKKQMK